MNAKKIIISWFSLYLVLGVIGFFIGMNAIIPGPSSLSALRDSEGEKLAIDKKLAPTDGFLILLSKKDQSVSEEEFNSAQSDLIKNLKLKTVSATQKPLFGMIQSSDNTFSIDNTKFVSKDNSSRLIIASGQLPVYESPKEFLEIPNLLKDWSLNYPKFKYGYLSNSTGEEEVFRLVQRDLDRSLIYTTPLTIIVLVWAFRSVFAAFIPLFIAFVSLVGSLGVSAMMSHVVEGISVTASQLVVLLVLAIGVDYSLFFLTRAREEKYKGLSVKDAIDNTKKSTGVAIMWSGVIVAVSLFGLLLIKDTVLNSMAIVAVVSVFMTLISCIVVLPNILTMFPKCLDVKKALNNDLKYTNFLINIGIKHPVLSVTMLSALLIFLSYFGMHLNLGNTMLPEVLPKSLQGMATYNVLAEKFPNLAGGDASVILNSDELEEKEESGEVEEAFRKLNELGLRGPFKVERTSDYTLGRFKFLLNTNGEDFSGQTFVKDLRDKILPELFSPLGIDAYFSGVVEHSVSEADKYKAKMPLLFATVLALSFVFLLLAFRSVVIPIKAMILNLLSTTASFGILVLVFQFYKGTPMYIGVIESFVPPLLFTILFGLSMDYHIFMLSRITEEFHNTQDTANSVRVGIKETSKTITSAALIMISVFFVAATLELPVMRQLGIGLGAAVLIDATLIRAILLPASMVLLGRFNWYLPKCLQWIPEIKI